MEYLHRLVIMHAGGSNAYEVGKLSSGSQVITIERSLTMPNTYHVTHESGVRLEIISPTAFLWYKTEES